MRFWLFLSWLAALRASDIPLESPQTDSEDHSPGIAFSISPGYGVASVWFSNGTYIDVAKVEGGDGYKQYMRDLQTYQRLAKEDSWSWECPFPKAYRSYCEYWQAQPRNPEVLSEMVAALKGATEARIGRPINATMVSSSVLNGYDDFVTDISLALSQAKLRYYRYNYFLRDHFDLAARSHPKRECSGLLEELLPWEYPPQKIMLVENTRDSLAMSIMTERCGKYHTVHESILPVFGHTAMSVCRLNSTGDCNSALSNAFLTFIKSQPRRIDVVVTFGEHGNDPSMYDMLERVLNDTNKGRPYSRSEVTGDPSFLASRIHAREMSERIKSEDYWSTRTAKYYRNDWKDDWEGDDLLESPMIPSYVCGNMKINNGRP